MADKQTILNNLLTSLERLSLHYSTLELNGLNPADRQTVLNDIGTIQTKLEQIIGTSDSITSSELKALRDEYQILIDNSGTGGTSTNTTVENPYDDTTIRQTITQVQTDLNSLETLLNNIDLSDYATKQELNNLSLTGGGLTVEQSESLQMFTDPQKPITKMGDDLNYLDSEYALNIFGKSKIERFETEMNYNRPVSWSMKSFISPPGKPLQITDFHGLDIYGSVSPSSNSLDLSNVRNYLFESKASYAGNGILGGNVAGFFESNNYGNGTINENKALRIYSRNFGAGHIKDLYGISIDSVVNNGTIENAYGIRIGTVGGATGKNYAIWSDGGNVKFNGDISNTGKIINAGDITNTGILNNIGDLNLTGKINLPYHSTIPCKLITKVGSNPWFGEIIPFSAEGGMILNVDYDGNGANIFFRIAGQNKMILKESGNFGIGIDLPTEKLHVNGKIKASSINFSNLPISAAGLVSGDVWNDGGILKII